MTRLHVLATGLGAWLALAGCEPVPPVPPPLPAEDACGATGLQSLVGKAESALAAMTLPAPLRIIRPGQAVTMDYQPGRLNIAIGSDGRIEKVYCG